MRRHSVKAALAAGSAVVVLAGGSAAAVAVATSLRPGAMVPGPTAPGLGTTSCAAPRLPGSVVKATLSDMGGAYARARARHRAGAYPGMMGGRGFGPMPGGPMMGYGVGHGGMMHRWGPGHVPLRDMMAGLGRGHMMKVRVDRHSVPAGTVSLSVTNTGAMVHELVVLPLRLGASPGQRALRTDGTVDEGGAVGEVSDTCGAGEGDGLQPGGTGWTTLHLRPGRYELVCNLPGHYAAGMFAELDVRR